MYSVSLSVAVDPSERSGLREGPAWSHAFDSFRLEKRPPDIVASASRPLPFFPALTRRHPSDGANTGRHESREEPDEHTALIVAPPTNGARPDAMLRPSEFGLVAGRPGARNMWAPTSHTVFQFV